ncbi:MAG: protein-methionine-sulfoxide reductase heme-binding subunit MsrQ [Gammaproteobacteria bacterium]
MSSKFLVRYIKPVVFMAGLIPLVMLLWKGLVGNLGANPIEEITHWTGDWTLRLLLITLTMTPLRRLSGWTWPLRIRRMIGLFAFFYGTLHLVTYVWLDQYFWWEEIVRDVIERPYITVGFLGYLLLIPLAVTSTNKMMRRLGGDWKRLHRLAYLVPGLGVLHFFWLVKADLQEPAIYAGILTVLLGARAWWRISKFKSVDYKPVPQSANLE